MSLQNLLRVHHIFDYQYSTVTAALKDSLTNTLLHTITITQVGQPVVSVQYSAGAGQ